MTFDPSSSHDDVLRRLARLPAIAPDPDRAAAVRLRCHEALRRPPAAAPAWRVDVVAAGVFAVLYLSAVLAHAAAALLR